MNNSINYEIIPELAKKMETVFDSNANDRKNAYLSWRMKGRNISERFKQLSNGYFQVSQNIIEELLKNNLDRQADIQIFPVLFGIVHGIELSLKALNYDINGLLGYNNLKIGFGKHDIGTICSQSIKSLKVLGQRIGDENIEQPLTAIHLIENFINNIYSQTAYMPFARYPINDKGEDVFYAKWDQNVIVDLEKLKSQFSYVVTMLEFLDDFIHYYIDERY